MQGRDREEAERWRETRREQTRNTKLRVPKDKDIRVPNICKPLTGSVSPDFSDTGSYRSKN